MSVLRASFLQRRLTKLYSDTKSSYESITKGSSSSKANDEPELLSIQREFRTQKDRLLAWGLDWSDASAAQPQDIDVSLNQAGFSEVVAGVMSTIQDLLTEAERLQEPTSSSGEKGRGSSKWNEAGLKSLGISPSDPKRVKKTFTGEEIQRSRDLLKQLKSSIDTLYELSRCRSVSRESLVGGHDRKKSTAESIQSFRSILENFDPKMAGSKHSLDARMKVFGQSTETLKNVKSVTTPTMLKKSVSEVDHVFPRQLAPSVKSFTLSRRPSVGTIASFRSAPTVLGSTLLAVSELDIRNAKDWDDKSFSTHSLYIDRNALDLSYADKAASNPPPYEVVVGSSQTRQIGTLKASGIWRHYATTRFKTEKSVPVLVEFIPMSSEMRTTGMLLPQDRLSELAKALRQIYQQRKSNNHFALLGFLGYFVDLASSRYAFVYLLPHDVPIRWSVPGSKNGREAFEPKSLSYLFENPEKINGSQDSNQPSLDDRFQFAYRLILALLHLRSQNLVHGQINSKNIFFLPSHGFTVYDIRTPYLASFAQFSGDGMRPSAEEFTSKIYRHPNDKRNITDSAAWTYDLYSLGLLLLEIALWMPIEKLWKSKYDTAIFRTRIQKIYLQKISPRCGPLYQSAVKLCLEAPDFNGLPPKAERFLSEREGGSKVLGTLHEEEPSSTKSPKGMVYAVQIAEKLYRCCALDSSWQGNDTELDTFKTEKDVSSLRSSINAIGQGKSEQRLSYDAHLKTLQSDMGKKIIAMNALQKERDELKRDSDAQRERIALLEKRLKNFEATSAMEELTPPSSNPAVKSSLQLTKVSDKSISPSPSKAPTIKAEIGIGSESREHEIVSRIGTSTPKRRTLRKWAQLEIPQRNLDEWNTAIMPKLSKLLQKALQDSPESCSASLMMVGDTLDSAKPTICVTCSSAPKVRAVLKRYLVINAQEWGLVVVKGDVRRSKQPRRKRKRPVKSSQESDFNPFYQKRPLCGASIGAFRDNEHLPPVSYGGAILVDGVPYGMTVHHMLDAPSDDEDMEYGDEFDTLRSAGPWSEHFDYSAQGFRYSAFDDTPPEALYPFEISDDEDDDSSVFDEDDLLDLEYEDFVLFDRQTDDEDMDDDDEDNASIGDTCGIDPGEDERLLVTQPAIDDVEDDYFCHSTDKDKEHLSSHSLGYVHASSGVRRWNRNGVKHEVDWALIKMDEDRLETLNVMPIDNSPYPLQHKKKRSERGSNTDSGYSSSGASINQACLDKVARLEDLRGLQVHCCGRTSGLQRGRISNAMTLVKMHGRQSFSSSWCVDGNFGVPGDSGAWVFDKSSGVVCGHVLAYCSKTQTAYIAPMQVLFEDIARSLGAQSVGLPGSSSPVTYELEHGASMIGPLPEQPSPNAKGKTPESCVSIPERLSTELSRLSLRREEGFAGRGKDASPGNGNIRAREELIMAGRGFESPMA